MANFVNVTDISSGVPVAAETVGTRAFQLVKFVDGAAGASTPIEATAGTPAAGSVGLIVSPKPGASVTAAVSGTVSVSGQVQVSGTVDVSVAVSVTTVVSGTVSVSGAVSVNTAPTVAGASVTIQQGASVQAVVSGTVSISGQAQVSGTVSVSNTVVVTLATGGTLATLLGTVQVTGANLQVSGTVSISNTVIVSVVPGVSVNIGSQATGIYTTTATSGATGPIVWLGASQSIIVSTLVSGTVSVSNTVVVTLATGGTLATLLGTVAVSIVAGGASPGTTAATQSAISAQVVWFAPTQTMAAVSTIATILSTVNVAIVAGAGGGGSVTTAVPSISATGQVIWIAGGQSTTAFPIVVTGTVSAGAGTTVISGTVSVSNTVVVTLATGGTLATLLGTVAVTGTIQNIASLSTILGTAVVSVVPGLSVSAVISGTVTAVLPGSTTGSSGMSGVLVWLGASQTVLVSTQISGTVSVSNTVVVTLATGGTLATLLGTVAVSIVAGGAAPGTTAATQSAISAQVIWLAPTQTLSVVSTVAAVLGTVIVTLATGGVVTMVGTVPVTGTIQNVASISTILGTAVVSVVPGVSVVAQQSGMLFTIGNIATASTGAIVRGIAYGLASGAVAAVPIAVNGAGQVFISVSGASSLAVSVSAFDSIMTTAAPSVTATGLAVWVANPGAAVATTIITVGTGTVVALDAGRTNVMFVYTSSSVGISGTTVPFSVYIGLSTPVAGTTSIVVPAGKTLRILAIELIAENSVTTAGALVRMMVVASTALPSWTSTTPVMAQAQVHAQSVAVPYSGIGLQVADIPPGATIGMAFTIGTSGASIVQALVKGYLFP